MGGSLQVHMVSLPWRLCIALQWLLVVCNNILIGYLGGKCIVYNLSLQFTIVAQSALHVGSQGLFDSCQPCSFLSSNHDNVCIWPRMDFVVNLCWFNHMGKHKYQPLSRRETTRSTTTYSFTFANFWRPNFFFTGAIQLASVKLDSLFSTFRN